LILTKFYLCDGAFSLSGFGYLGSLGSLGFEILNFFLASLGCVRGFSWASSVFAGNDSVGSLILKELA
jgi:hypothetical protein